MQLRAGDRVWYRVSKGFGRGFHYARTTFRGYGEYLQYSVFKTRSKAFPELYTRVPHGPQSRCMEMYNGQDYRSRAAG